jgi:hypothetical protein
MSAAATAAGYLYASGRLRGRKDAEEPEKKDSSPPAAKRRIRIAAIPEQQVREAAPASEPAPRARPAPKIEYRVRRWRPE